MSFVRWVCAVFVQWVAALIGLSLVSGLALYSEFTGVPISPHWYVVAAIIALFQAMFLAWRDQETRRLAAELKIKGIENDKPQLFGFSSGWSVDRREVGMFPRENVSAMVPTLRIYLEIVNSGIDTSLRGWQGVYVLSNGKRTFLSDAMFDRGPSNNPAQINLVTDDRTLSRGGRRLEWVQFPISEDDARQIRQVTIQFLDHTGEMHSIQTPPEHMVTSSD